MDLKSPIKTLSRVGETTAAKLKTLGLNTVEDLLFYLPFRYDDFSEQKKIADLRPGERVNIVGQIELMETKKSWRRRLTITEALISDDSATIKVIWFNQPFLSKTLHTGETISLSGKVEDEYGSLVMRSPVYEKVGGQVIHTQGLVPVYGLTANLTQKQIRFLISQALPAAKQLIDDLPDFLIKKYNFLSLAEALRQSHFPTNQAQIAEAKKRLAFDEALGLQLKVAVARLALVKAPALAVPFQEEFIKDLVKSLPFALTVDQKRAAWETILDLGKNEPMTRLLEGDVGSGKTAVALLALANVATAGQQGVLLAPTEILARQHFLTFSRLLKDTKLTVALLTRTAHELSGQEKITKTELLKTIAGGQASIIIGTHALLQEKVLFKNLALLVVDEQHRFGVAQRQALIAKAHEKTKQAPHLLSMTATPIPRSLALTLFDDLSLSLIKTMPLGRLSIETRIIDAERRTEAYDLVRAELTAGRQAFIICPLIEESDRLGVKAVTSEFANLQAGELAGFKLGLLHGRLKAKDKEEIMRAFQAGEIQALVATAVVEVGIDVPNATIMLVENADRFGLAQLHQYRGRVGRGEHQSYCLLMSEQAGDPTSLKSFEGASRAGERLGAMLRFNNGFDLAQADLKFRGPGEVYGTLQKGFVEFKVANLFDVALMKAAKEASQQLLSQSPDLSAWPTLQAKIKAEAEKIHFE